MSFGSVLSGIYHAVTPWHDSGSVFSKSSYQPKKKPQPGDPGYVAPAPAAAPRQAVSNVQVAKPQTPISQQIANVFDNNKNLMFGQNPNNAIDVAKAQATPPVLSVQPGQVVTPTNQRPLDHQSINQGLDAGKSWEQIAKDNNMDVNDVKQYSQATRPNYGISNPKPSAPVAKPSIPFWKRAVHDVGNVAGAGAGAALGTLRAAEGAVQGVSTLPAAAVHAVTYVPRKIVGDDSTIGKNLNATNKLVDEGTKIVTKPLDWLGRKTDEASMGFGQAGADVYHPFQVAANVATVVPAAIEGGAALASKLSDAGELGQTNGAVDLLARAKELIDTQRYSPILTSLNERLGGSLSNIPFINKIISAGQEIPTGPNITPTDVPSIPGKKGSQAQKPSDVLTENEVDQLTKRPTQIQVQQPRPIDVAGNPGEPVSVPVTNSTPVGEPIRELGGDRPGVVSVPSPDDVAVQRASQRFDEQLPGRPDPRIQGVGNPVSTKDLEDVKATLDDNLATGKISKEQHDELTQQLSEIKPTDTPPPKGQPIQVKTVDSIPVKTGTDVPTGLDESPGKVTTTAAAPANEEAAAVANTPTAVTPQPLSKETQNILDNPKQFNKRQVAAARNQRKMANAVAKANEDTADALDRIKTASPAAMSDEGFNSTGEFGKSANGGSYEKVGRKAEMKQALTETSQVSPGDVVKTARENQAATGGFNRRDIRNVMAMFESKRVTRGTPEYNELKAILKEDGTHQAQALALRGGNVIRRTATGDQLTSQFESKVYRLADDPTKIDSKAFDAVDAAEQKFTQARDDATAANNRFTESPTHANAKAYHAAADAADSAEKEAKMTEYKIAQSALKGNKDVKQVREIEKMAQGAGLYKMDAVDASMLSGTGTFVRNLVNAGTSAAEEGLFGGASSRIAGKITGEEVGGGVGRGTLSGLKEGVSNVVDASKARAKEAGFNPLEHIKNYATTGNELGDTLIDSQVKHNLVDHYTQTLKDEGYKGRELTDRASVMARQDPDNVAKAYQGAARAAAGLGGGITRNNKVETLVKNAISDAISLGHPNKFTENTAKLVTRMTIGFPTAIGRSTAEGVKRFTLGAPTFIKAIATKDPQQKAILIKEAFKQAGTGAAVIPPLFYALGSSGMITGAYPPATDPEERAKWQREGISENSVKIGGNYYQLPSYLGAWAVPGLFYASLGRNGGDWGAAAADTAKIVPSLLPTEQAGNIQDVINGNTDLNKFMSQTGAAAVRAATPAGALLNQIAKSFDSTKNDTTGGSNLENFISKIETGIPGVSSKVPNATDDAGNTISNPSAGPLALGASTASQEKGVARTGQLVDQVQTALKGMGDSGALGDPNLKGVLDDKTLQIYNKATSGKEISQADLKKLQDGLTKGISSNGEDSAYLEKEQYDTNIASLKLKRELMGSDKTTKPSDLKKMDTAITRGQVYKDNNVPYDMIHNYEKTSVADWRKMGDPQDDTYDPDMYQKLWDIDQKMTKAGVSYNTAAQEKQKYSAKQVKAKKAKTGKAAGLGTDFGTLKAGDFAPQVQDYKSLATQTGSVPIIQTVRPNIVHKISSSG